MGRHSSCKGAEEGSLAGLSCGWFQDGIEYLLTYEPTFSLMDMEDERPLLYTHLGRISGGSSVYSEEVSTPLSCFCFTKVNRGEFAIEVCTWQERNYLPTIFFFFIFFFFFLFNNSYVHSPVYLIKSNSGSQHSNPPSQGTPVSRIAKT